jgi:hypothetical protein
VHELFMTHHVHIDCTGSLDEIIHMLDAVYAQHVIIDYDHVVLRRMPRNRFSLSIECAVSVLV